MVFTQFIVQYADQLFIKELSQVSFKKFSSGPISPKRSLNWAQKVEPKGASKIGSKIRSEIGSKLDKKDVSELTTHRLSPERALE